MFHKAIDLEFKQGTVLELTFSNGNVKSYDMARLFDKYPQLRALEDRELFLSGRLAGRYGVIWNDELDIEAETVYQEGETVRTVKPPAGIAAGDAVLYARAVREMTQAELSVRTGIAQSDISKIERGVANPSVATLKKIADALDAKLVISFDIREEDRSRLSPVSRRFRRP